MSPFEEIQSFLAHVEALQEEFGVDLTEAGKADLVRHIQQNGFNPDSTRAGFVQIASEGLENGAADQQAYEYEPAVPDAEEVDDAGPYGSEYVDADVGQRFQNDVTTELTRLSKKLGRHFTEREMHAMGDHMLEQAVRKDYVSAEEAMQAFDEDNGRKPQDEWNNGDWAKWGAERMQDSHDRTQAEQPPKVLDPDNNLNDLIAYAQHRAAGGEVDYTED